MREVREWARGVASFWFALDPQQWWAHDDVLDTEIHKRFGPLWAEQRVLPPEAFLDSAQDALAAVILFDQFPRNMFRGDAQAFATDPLALAIAKEALDKGYDAELGKDEKTFLLMPLEHSEDIDDQERSLLEFTALGDPDLLHFAQLHHDIVARFGRFPHRNEMLGRPPRREEIAAGPVVPW